MGKNCNCKANENIKQLRRFFNRGKDEPTDTFRDKFEKHALRILGNICVILALPIAIPYVLIVVKRNQKKGIGRVFKFNSNKWKPFIQREINNYK